MAHVSRPQENRRAEIGSRVTYEWFGTQDVRTKGVRPKDVRAKDEPGLVEEALTAGDAG